MKLIFIFLLLVLPLSGQFERPSIPKEDQAIADRQAGEFFYAIRAVTGKAGKSVVPLYSFRNPIGFGVSLGDGFLLAKLSEVASAQHLLAFSEESGALKLKVLGAYPEHDLAIVYGENLDIPAAEWMSGSELPVGSFLTAVRQDGEAAGIGVKSVATRSLRTEDQGFLGIEMDISEFGDGVRVSRVTRRSAASAVGMKSGDIITEINGARVKGFHEVSTRLKRIKVGEKPEITIIRKGKALKVTPTLQGNPLQAKESRQIKMMQGGRSEVHDGFPKVMQSDMELEVHQTGLPVVDLEARVVGMVIARAGRISTLILPGEVILDLLAQEPVTNAHDAEKEKIDTLLTELREKFSE